MMRTAGQGYMPKQHQEWMEDLIEIAGPNCIWWVDTKWDMKMWPNRGPQGRGDPKVITFKTDVSTVNTITNWMNSNPQRRKRIAGSRQHDYVSLIFGFGDTTKKGKAVAQKPQIIKIESTGKVLSANGQKVSEATMTAMQELGTLWVFKRAIQDNKEFKRWEDIKNDKDTWEELERIWTLIGKVPTGPGDEWLEVFYKQNEVFLREVGKSNVSAINEFTRGAKHGPSMYHIPGSKSSDTFMDWISDWVKQYGISQKDNWNPADIWLIKNEDYWRKRIEAETKVEGGKSSVSVNVNLQQLNSILREAYNSHSIIGVSLKKIGRGDTARYQAVNTTEEFVSKRSDINYKKTYVYDGSRCYLNRKSDGSVTQDSWIFIKAGDINYKFQVKANSSSDRSGSGLKYEGQQEGATAARLGKATVKLVLDLMEDYKLSFSSNKLDYPFSVDQLNSQRSDYVKKLKYIKSKNCSLSKDPGPFTEEQAYDNLLYLMQTEPHVANSKCQQISWLYQVLQLESQGDQLRLFLADLVFLSKKEGLRYGPFGKIY